MSERDARTRERLERHVLDATVALRSAERQIEELHGGRTPIKPGFPGFAARSSELHVARSGAERALRSAVDDLVSAEPEPTEPPVPWMTVEEVVDDAFRVLRLHQRTHDVFERASPSAERAAAIRAEVAAGERLRRDVAAYVREQAAGAATGATAP